jgi:Protein of unknown function (DUF3097)
MRRDYGPDVLAPGASRPRRRDVPSVPAERGLVVEEPGGFCGAVVECEKHLVTLEDRFGRRRVFPLTRGGFLLEGKPVTLVRPVPAGGRDSARNGSKNGGKNAPRTASGSIAAPRPAAGAAARAKVARASRIYVEGRQDAELVERIWGDDLRDVGVVVECLEGVDRLYEIVASFCPGPGRRLGILVDHLVTGSKESRIASGISSPHVLVVGHPFIDIWQAVKPEVLGIAEWPAVPQGTPWKEGVLAALGWSGGVTVAWQRILSATASYADLEPALLGRVEELIDFVTTPGTE